MVNHFDIFAISEHSLFTEQLDMLDHCTDFSYKGTAVSSKDNPPILSGKQAHGGVALCWRISIDDLVTPLENIDSDRIVGIRCDFPDSDPLFILSVYLPASNHSTDELMHASTIYGLCMSPWIQKALWLSWATVMVTLVMH